MELQRIGNTVEPRKFSSRNYFRSSYARIGHQIGLLDSRLATDGVKSSEGGVPTTLAIASMLSACGGDTPTETNTLAGSYRATTFRVTPSGQAAIDVLAQSGPLTITIGTNNATSGSLVLPAGVTGGTALTENMAGTAVRTGNAVQSQQAADTFVCDLTWTVSGNALSVTDQAAGSARFTITLARR